MPKGKNYKKLVKLAFIDKIKNTVFMMKFLDAKGGLNLVREYFADALPGYILKYDGLGDAQKWILRQLARNSPHAFMRQIGEKARKDGEYMAPRENFDIIEDTKEQISVSIKCDFIKNILKQSKRFECNFDARDYYCNNACIPLLLKVYDDLYLQMDIQLNENGCVQTMRVNQSKLRGENLNI